MGYTARRLFRPERYRFHLDCLDPHFDAYIQPITDPLHLSDLSHPRPRSTSSDLSVMQHWRSRRKTGDHPAYIRRTKKSSARQYPPSSLLRSPPVPHYCTAYRHSEIGDHSTRIALQHSPSSSYPLVQSHYRSASLLESPPTARNRPRPRRHGRIRLSLLFPNRRLSSISWSLACADWDRG